jgi:hypothetical protein
VDFEERDERGRVTFRGRISREEAERRRQAASEPPAPRPQPANPMAAAPPARGPETPAAVPGSDANATAAPAGREPLPEDPKVRSISFEKHLLPASDDTGFLTGVVVSKYDVGLAKLRLQPQVLDSSDRVVATLGEFVCEFIPAGSTARYSVPFEAVPQESLAKVRMSAKAEPMDAGLVCYDAEVHPAFERSEKAVVATGAVRNTGAKAIREAYVHCDFYTRDGKFVKSARGELDEEAGGRLLPGAKNVRFKAELRLDEPDPTQSISQAVARVVGKEE